MSFNQPLQIRAAYCIIIPSAMNGPEAAKVLSERADSARRAADASSNPAGSRG